MAIKENALDVRSLFERITLNVKTSAIYK